MNQEVFNPLLQIIQDTFEKTTNSDLDHNYLKWTKNEKKWSYYSDYCFDDRNKPNDVVCFTIIPYIDDFKQLSDYIETIAKVDIKKTRKVQTEFVFFLKSYPLINFSFILNDRKKILGKDHDEVKIFLKNTFEFIKQQYIDWGYNQPEQKDYYGVLDKKLNCIIQLIDGDKKIKQIVSMLLVTFFGAYVSSRVIKENEIDLFGWFSDRDALNEVSDNFSIDLFHYYLHGLTNGKKFGFAASPAGSKDNAFYEELARIPDYIAGAIADYNMQGNLISHDKFNTMLTDYMAENVHNNFVYRVFMDEDKLSCARITFHKKEI
jgi:hypothetical protein